MIILEITMSLDGYIAGPAISDVDKLGRNGERLHDWMFAGKSAAEVERFQDEHFANAGAVIAGRTMADLGIGPWGDEPAFRAPCFVVTHRPAEPIVKRGGTTYHFVTDGVDAALTRAREAAGDQDVVVIGGADIAQQYLNAGVIDELQLHVAPILLGGGTPLFAGVRTDLELAGPLPAHLTYEVTCPARPPAGP